MPLGFRATSPAVIVPRAMIPRGATRNRFGAASVIVGELRGFRSWSPLSGESRLVRNSWERLRPSNKAAPDPTPPQDCPPLRQTKGDLPRRFSRGLSSEFAKKRSDVLLPWCEESRDSKSRTHWGRRNELDRNCEAPPVEGHREWMEREREAAWEPQANPAKERNSDFSKFRSVSLPDESMH